MVRTISLDEELFRVPSKTKHLAMTRSEFFLVYRCRLIRVHVRLTGSRSGTSRIFVYLLSATLNVRLSTDVGASLRFRLWVALILSLCLCGTHLLTFRRCSSLRVF